MGYTQISGTGRRPARPRPKPPRRKIVRDPLAPLSDAQLQAQSHSIVNAQLSPLIAQARASAEARAASGSQAIQQYTGEFAQSLQGYADRAKAAFGQAEQGQAKSSEALRALLTGAGSSLSADLSNKLTAIGAPDAAQQQIAGGAAQTGAGAANAGYAQSSSDLQSLMAQGANQQGYSNALPGIVALQGLQSIKQLQAQTTSELADQITQVISSQGPAAEAQLYQHLVDNELQKALARQSGQFKGAQVTADAYYKAQQIAYKRADLKWRAAKGAADRAEKAREANQRAATSRRNAQTSAQRAAESARHNRQNERNQNLRQNKWATNPDGSFKYRKNKKTGKRERIPLPGGKKSGGSSSGL